MLAGAMLLLLGVTGGRRTLRAAVAPAADAVQNTFETTVADLSSPDPRVRLRAVQLLKGAGHPEAAVPLARIVNDPDDELQFEAIAAELNIFLAQRITPKKRVGLIVEVRGRISAEPIFSGGPSVLGPTRVPVEVASALAMASRDKNLRLAVEAMYAFGALAGDVRDADRPAVLEQAAAVFAPMMGVPDPTMRLAAVRVAGRVWARRPGDPPLSDTIGDATISALNDGESAIRETAMWALGAMRNERAVQALGDLFQYYRKGPLAESAFAAMARIGHDGSMPHFVAQLSSKDPVFRLLAIEGISRTGDRSRSQAIHQILEKEKSDALLLGGHFSNALLADGPIEAIVEALTRTKLHNQALQYLQDVAYGRTALFAKHLQDPDAKVREELADVLGLSGDISAIPFIEPIIKDREPDVAFAATRALARLQTAAPRPQP
jgi:HEAT repeat protein